MLPRFITPMEKKYNKKFPNYDIGLFWHREKEQEYQALIEKAIKRDSHITVNELKEYMGKETFKRHIEYLKEWSSLPNWII